jgi:hypothetical protein
MAEDDTAQLQNWLANGTIKRLDAYVGEIFPGSYASEHVALCKIVRPSGGRVCVFRNHAKVFAGWGPLYAFGIASSANVNTNPRNENTVVSPGWDTCLFYKTFFDGVRSYNRDFDEWTPALPPGSPSPSPAQPARQTLS